MKKALLILFLSVFATGTLFAQYKSYRIKKGETLESLAKKFEVSQETLLKFNPDLKKGHLTQKVIVIPPKETDDGTPRATVVRFKEYRVGKKQTLYSIAKKNHISIADIKRYNPYLYDDVLGENDMIRIPVFRRGADNAEINESVQTSTFANLLHIVLPKETKYGIAKKYGMTVEELDSLNPYAGKLHPGQVLKVLNPIASERTQGLYRYYTVQSKETYYSLTHKFDISKDSLIKLNPVLNELGIQAGMELKIPKNMRAFQGPEMSSDKLDLTHHLTNLSTKKLVVFLPFNLQEFEGSHIDKEEALRKDKMAQIALDLYSGIKAAIDSVQKLGISVNARVFDTQQNSAHIDQILSSNNFDNTQIVIGPLLPDNIEHVAKQINNNDAAIFSPLTSDDLYGSNNIVQTRPSKLMKAQVLMAYIDKHKDGKNILILADEKHEFFKSKLLAHFPSAQVVQQEKEEYLQQSDLTKLLSKDRPNWVILITDEFGDISNSVSYLNALRNVYDIRLFTSDKNDNYDRVHGQALGNLNFTYAAINKSGTANRNGNFVKTYIKRYGITPNQYAIRGFDLTFDALLRSASAKDIFDGIKLDGVSQHVENRFEYHKKLLGGYFNNAVYLLKYNKDLSLEVLN